MVIAILAAIVAAVLIYVAVVINAKSRRRARRRDAAEPAVAVQGAWDEALDKLREAHVPPDPALTPLELAGSAPRRGVTAATRPLRSLARSYTVVRYGGGPASSADAERAWDAVDELDRALDEGLTRTRTVAPPHRPVDAPFRLAAPVVPDMGRSLRAVIPGSRPFASDMGPIGSDL